ncbi:MAG: hypothetical protein ACK5OX_02850 [Desertimonas sp.]
MNRQGPGAWRPDADAVRRSVIDAGIELLAEEGLALAADRVSIERSAARAKVSRAAAYKLWSGLDRRPQEAFRDDVLVHSAEQVLRSTKEEMTSTVTAIAEALERFGPIADLAPDQRRRALREVVRVGALANLEQLIASPGWHIYLSVLAAVRSRDLSAEPAPPKLVEAIRIGSEQATRLYGPTYVMLGQLFGMRIRPGYEVEELTAAAAALVDGMALRVGLSDHLTDIASPYDTDGPWHLFAVAFMGLVREFFEADPEVPWGVDP